MKRYPWKTSDWIEPAWSERQLQVLPLIEKGYTNGEIADELGVSFAGAKWHVGEVISKLGVTRREDVAAYWRWRRGYRRRVGNATRAIIPAGSLPLAGGAIIAVALVAAGLVALVVYLDDRGADSDLVELPRDLPFEDGVYCVHDQGFCVSESREGELIALDTLTTNPYFRERGCTVSWRWIGEPDVAAYQLPPGEKSAFYEGCGGAVFDRDGLPGFGPAWRALDRYPLEVTGNTIVVDLGMRIEGKPRPTSQR